MWSPPAATWQAVKELEETKDVLLSIKSRAEAAVESRDKAVYDECCAEYRAYYKDIESRHGFIGIYMSEPCPLGMRYGEIFGQTGGSNDH